MPNILVIDDQPDIHRVVEGSVPDCIVIGATSGTDGLEILRDRGDTIHLVVLDLKKRLALLLLYAYPQGTRLTQQEQS